MIDESIARRSIDDAGGAHEAERAEDHSVASSKLASTIVDRVPCGHAEGGGSLVHAADSDACSVWGTAAPAAYFERSFASPRVDHDAQGATSASSAFLGASTGLSTCFKTWTGLSVTVSVEVLRGTERFFAAEEVAPEAAVYGRQEKTQHGALLVEAAFRRSSSTRYTRTTARRASGLGAWASQGIQAGARSGRRTRPSQLRPAADG